MKLPRDLDGTDLERLLRRNEYEVARKSSSYLRLTSSISVVGAGIMLLCAMGCSSRPSAKVSLSHDTAKVSVATLGEYPTTIIRARLQDESSRGILWEIDASSGTPQIQEVVLRLGLNSATALNPMSGTYRVVVPQSSEPFELQPDRAYTLELWSDSAGKPAKAAQIRFSK